VVLLKTIALADDQRDDMELLKRVLVSLGYTVVGMAESGQEAIELVKREKPQILMMDVNMPGMGGLDTLKQIAPLKTTAVIMLTSDPTIELVRAAMAAGAYGYSTKPYTAMGVTAVLESTWHRAQAMVAADAEKQALMDQLEVRKLSDKAKGILMEQQGFSEDEAHRCLQKMSQDQGIPLKDVCRSLIQVRMVLGKTGSRKAAVKPQGGR
jgi:AmiR/NasT family two-component response regulator